MMPSGRMTLGTLLVGCLLLHGVFILIYFCVAPVLAMPYCSRLVGGLPIHVVLVLLKFAKCSELSSLLVQVKLLVGDPNHQRNCGNPNVLPPNLIVYVASALWPGLLFFQSDHEWPPAPWLQK